MAHAEEEWVPRTPEPAPPEPEPAPVEPEAPPEPSVLPEQAPVQSERPPEPAESAAVETEPPPEARPRRPSPATPAEGGRLDLNALGFEDLRALRLSITQSNRLLRQREQRGGFRSIEDLDTVPGFPREVIAELKRRCRV